MNFHLALKLITIPTLVGSVLTLKILTERVSAADASYATTLATSQAACELPSNLELKSSIIRHRNQDITVASAGSISDETALLNFSDAESDAADVLFGCDCPACINALRQLRSQPLLNNSSGHCWASLQRLVSPQRMQEVLQNLEMREAEQGR